MYRLKVLLFLATVGKSAAYLPGTVRHAAGCGAFQESLPTSRTRHYALLIATALAWLPMGASAAPLLFTLEGSRNASFTLDSNPTPDSFTSLQTNFNNVAGTFNGMTGVASLIDFGQDVSPFSAARLNILAPGLGFTQFSGDNIFGGTTAAPIFTPGVFRLNNPFFGGPATLTITGLADGGSGSAVPEPASWAMLILGFGFVGTAARRRNRSIGANMA